jgi:hypothetical protein
MYTENDLADMQEAVETGICPICGCEIDNGADDCTNPIHDMV